MVRTTEIRIAPEVSGRVARFLVAPGRTVQRDQPVALLDNPELWAALGEARAQTEKARSDRDRVYAGVRDEQVQGLQREIEKARAVHAQAAQDLVRKTVLAARSDASQQELDLATAAEARDRADIAVAEAQYAEAQRGPTAEEMHSLMRLSPQRWPPRVSSRQGQPKCCCALRLPAGLPSWSPRPARRSCLAKLC
jgi:HlyD family secretion protein